MGKEQVITREKGWYIQGEKRGKNGIYKGENRKMGGSGKKNNIFIKESVKNDVEMFWVERKR